MKSISVIVGPERFAAIREAIAAINVRSITVVLYSDPPGEGGGVQDSPDASAGRGQRTIKLNISVEDEQEEPVLHAISGIA